MFKQHKKTYIDTMFIVKKTQYHKAVRSLKYNSLVKKN